MKFRLEISENKVLADYWIRIGCAACLCTFYDKCRRATMMMAEFTIAIETRQKQTSNTRTLACLITRRKNHGVEVKVV